MNVSEKHLRKIRKKKVLKSNAEARKFRKRKTSSREGEKKNLKKVKDGIVLTLKKRGEKSIQRGLEKQRVGVQGEEKKEWH